MAVIEEPLDPAETPRLAPQHDLVPNGTIELFSGDALVRWTEVELLGSATATFDWFAGTYIEATGDNSPHAIIGMDEVAEIDLQGVGVISTGEPDETNFTFPAGHWSFGWRIDRAEIGELTAPLCRIDFQIGNFRPYRRVQGDGPPAEAPWRVVLEGGGWLVVIDQLEDAHDRLRTLKRIRAGSTMHAGRLLRADDDTFAWADGKEVLEGLTALLSFAAGDRAPVIMPTGYDDSGMAVVQQWGDPKRAPYAGRLSWLGPQRVGALETVWDTYIRLWLGDEQSKQVVQVAVELYCDAQRGNTETRLVHAQTALELAAWHWLAAKPQQLDPADVDKKTAAWRLRRMLERIDVPAAIPASLQAACKQWPNLDGPSAISSLRNSIVHPTDVHALLELPSPAKFDILRLSMWYLDMALLRLVEFEGEYLNRTQPLPIFEADTESVPWADPQAGGHVTRQC